MRSPICRRGEVWVADFNPGRGSEQRGIRPALVIQNDIGNQHAATTIVAAITTTIRDCFVTVVLDPHVAGLEQRSMINLAQILTSDKTRLMRKLGALSEARVKDVDTALRISLGLAD